MSNSIDLTKLSINELTDLLSGLKKEIEFRNKERKKIFGEMN